MKKIIVGILSIVTAMSVSIKVQGSDLQGVNGQAEVTLTTGNGPISPVDPDNPINPDPPIPPGEIPDNQSGPLQINYVAPIEFGRHIPIDTMTVVTHAKNTTTPFFQVTDLRGNGEGWVLKASLSEFVSTSDSTKRIKGASLIFQQPQIITNQSETSEGVIASEYQQLIAGSGSLVPIMTAKKNTGKGTWAVAYPKVKKEEQENTKIIFQANSRYIEMNTNYEATLLFDLFDGPNSH